MSAPGESRRPGPFLGHPCHGSLDAITDSERRALRPIGTTAHAVATRTSALLAGLPLLPGMRIFQCLRPAAAGLPLVAHALSAGRALLLIESVAWPPGRYDCGPDGAVHCDGVYIGQSVRPLLGAVAHWRQALPEGHQVSALVVVYPAGDGEQVLPSGQLAGLTWSPAVRAAELIGARLPGGGPPVSLPAIAALAAATLPGAGTGPEEIR